MDEHLNGQWASERFSPEMDYVQEENPKKWPITLKKKKKRKKNLNREGMRQNTSSKADFKTSRHDEKIATRHQRLIKISGKMNTNTSYKTA